MKISLLILSLFVILLTGCQDTKSNLESREKLRGNQNIVLVKKMLTEGDNNNVDFLNELCAPDYKYYFPSNANPLTVEEHKEIWTGFNQAFPDLTHTIKDIYAVDDIVVARLTVSGTHKGELGGIPATGQTVEVGQLLMLRFNDSKLIELREEADLLGFYTQLGMELQMKNN
ncbi:MAG: ester cyclase [Flavobacteriaceae bacterium]|nr:MAG: ester cyclase [Flavobacteriaceae bacterium]